MIEAGAGNIVPAALSQWPALGSAGGPLGYPPESIDALRARSLI